MTESEVDPAVATDESRAEREDVFGYHEPVLSDRVLDFLRPEDERLYLDGTVGGGGHARRILEACQTCRLLAVDRDPEALEEARTLLAVFGDRVRFLHSRFEAAADDLEARDQGFGGALLDLGVSSHQLDADPRGFTFRRGVALDMRMDSTEGDDARAFLNEATEDRLASVFRDFGGEQRSRRLAREVVKRRATEPFETSDQLVAALAVAKGRSPSAQDKARIFQAVRIAVNEEIDSLELALPVIREALNEGAVLVVIAYHSLEDRVVKNAFRDWSKACVCPPELPACMCRGHALGTTLTKKPVRADSEEVGRNVRARSARLRAWRKAA
jgi:16S rRNA (cytosine1402-N4)-methyltransferase